MSRLTGLGALTELADGDLVYVVDVSDTTDNGAGSSKGITKANLKADLQGPGIDDNATSVAITIDSSENVGVGKTDPDHPLDVEGVTKSGKFISSEFTVLANATATLSVASGTDGGIFVLSNEGFSSDCLMFCIRSAGGGQKAVILSVQSTETHWVAGGSTEPSTGSRGRIWIDGSVDGRFYIKEMTGSSKDLTLTQIA